MTSGQITLPSLLGRTWFVTLAAVLGAAGLSLLVGCASGPAYVPSAASAQAGEARVTGRLRVTFDGKQAKWGLFHPALIIVAPAGGHEGMINELKRDDGRFFWSLAPGKYLIVGVIYRPSEGITAHPSQTLRVAADFTVSPDAKSVYIGTLGIQQSSTGGYRVGVEDDYDEAVAAYREQFPDVPAPTKALMHRESELGSYTHFKPICAPDWGLACTKTYHGITPLSPAVEAEGFPLVNNLRPEFR